MSGPDTADASRPSFRGVRISNGVSRAGSIILQRRAALSGTDIGDPARFCSTISMGLTALSSPGSPVSDAFATRSPVLT
eukprot:1847475-Rhodomonas_salina.2